MAENNQLPLDDTEEICREVIDKFPQYVRLHQVGGAALGFLVGQVMKESGDSLNRKVVAATLKRMMEETK